MSFEYVMAENLSLGDFSDFISETDQDFVPPLCSRVNINDYYSKLCNKAEILLCLDSKRIVGMIAFYCNDVVTKEVYVTFIAVLPEYRGNSIASNLLERAVDVSLTYGMRKIKIDTNSNAAYRCYLKNGFHLKKTTFLSEYNLNRYFLEKEL